MDSNNSMDKYGELLVLPNLAIPLWNIIAIQRVVHKDSSNKQPYIIVFSTQGKLGGELFTTADKAEWEDAYAKSLAALNAYHARVK